MFKKLRDALKIKEIRTKLLFTVVMIIVVRIGCQLPVPGVDPDWVRQWMETQLGDSFNFLDAFTGGSFMNMSLLALNITPYITSSIIMQLLTIAIPALEEMQKEGGEGRKKIASITRYVTVGLALIEATAMAVSFGGQGLIKNYGVFSVITVVAALTAGSAFVMWIGERIHEKGIGNGISIILFANIVSRGPAIVNGFVGFIKGEYAANGETKTLPQWLGILIAVVGAIVAVAMIAFIVWMTNSERRLPVQYAKKVVGRKMYGGQSSNLPIKVNMTGVMPIIFANSIITVPATIAMFTGQPKSAFWRGFLNLFDSGSWFYALLTLVLLIAFSYFYIAISFDPVEVSNNIKSQGGFIPGIRPGRPTAEYIKRVLNRVTFIGAVLLAVVAVLPLIANIASGGALSSIAFGGSSIIIVVGVVLETIREIEAQMTMRHYKGFLE